MWLCGVSNPSAGSGVGEGYLGAHWLANQPSKINELQVHFMNWNIVYTASYHF